MPRRSTASILECVLLALGTISLLTNFFWFVDRYAVNLLFNDEWDLYNTFAAHPSAWELFRYQWGPHRQGAAFLLTRFLAERTAWNTRVESFHAAGLIAAAMVIALVLKWKLFHRLGGFDLLIPLMFLTTAQYETLLLAPNAAHSAAPLFLVTMSALVATWRHAARAPLLLLLEFVTIHTGFGFLAGFLFIALPALEVWKTSRSGDLARRRLFLRFLFCALAVAGVFLIDYHPHSAARCFSFPDPNWGFYLSFVTLMLGAFGGFLLGTAPMAYALLSTAVGAVALWVIFRASLRLVAARSIDEDPRSLVVAGLGLFSFVFAASVAIGRICFSPAYGQSSRYMTLLIPVVLAIDLEVAAMINVRWRSIAGVLLAAIVLHGYISPIVPPSHPAAIMAEEKKQWSACYLSTLDRGHCDRVSRLDVYGGGATDTLDRKLRYIRLHRLNIFAP